MGLQKMGAPITRCALLKSQTVLIPHPHQCLVPLGTVWSATSAQAISACPRTNIHVVAAPTPRVNHAHLSKDWAMPPHMKQPPLFHITRGLV